MNSVRQALGEALISDAGVGAVADGGVHYSSVLDQTLRGSFCIYHLESGVALWAMRKSGLDSDVWVVKGVSKQPGVAEDIDAAARAALDGSDLELFCRRLGPVSYSAVEDGETYYFRGSKYRVVSDAG